METKKNNGIVRRLAETMEKKKLADQAFYEDVNQIIEINKNMRETIIKNEKEIQSLKRKLDDSETEFKQKKQTPDFLEHGLAKLTKQAFQTGAAGNSEATSDDTILEDTSFSKRNKNKKQSVALSKK